jgi:hypothetical protein
VPTVVEKYISSMHQNYRTRYQRCLNGHSPCAMYLRHTD